MRHRITNMDQSVHDTETTVDSAFWDLLLENLDFDISFPMNEAPEPAPVPPVPQPPIPPAPPVSQAPVPPAAPVYQAPGPVYQAPAPVYQAPAPVYQAPAGPVYQAPGPVSQGAAAPQPNFFVCNAVPGSSSQGNNVHYFTFPQGQGNTLTPLGIINGQLVYGVRTFTAPPVTPDVPVAQGNTRKRKFFKINETKPYIKKPPNAYMIFRMEQRPSVVAELKNSDCAAVNRVIGQRWRSMSSEEQKKYYDSAELEKQRHSELFPEWSAGDNYGTKKKRIRRKGPTMT